MSKMQTAPLAGFTAGARTILAANSTCSSRRCRPWLMAFNGRCGVAGRKPANQKFHQAPKVCLRGLMRLDNSQHLPRLFFTEAGLAELRGMMADRRFAARTNLLMSEESWVAIRSPDRSPQAVIRVA